MPIEHPRRAWIWLVLICGASKVAGHEVSRLPVPAEPGVMLQAALAAGHGWAEAAWPAAHLPGILTSGNTPVDRRGWALEHATLAAGLRLSPNWSAAAVAGWHDQDPHHMELAWLQYEAPLDNGDVLELGAGRRALPMGQVLQEGGHFDRFGAVPLVKRATIDGDWIDDGVNVRWQRSHTGPWSWLQSVDVGVWRAAVFPGGQGADPVPAVHLRLSVAGVVMDGFAATMRPSPRATRVQSATAAHTHDQPSCSASLVGVLCFDGRTDLVGGSVSSALPSPFNHWRVSSSGLLRRDRGQLYSLNGDAVYSGTTGGYWTDLVWRMNDQVELALRLEQVRAVQSITGRSAYVVATDAGITGSTRLQRQSLGVAWTPAVGNMRFSLEAGRDRVGQQDVPFQTLRWVWTPSPWQSAW
jgi:hypothetical protein